MPRLGITSTFWINTGTFDAALWILLDLISDLTVTSNWNEGESSVRRGRIQTFEQTNLYFEFAGKVRKEIANAAYNAVRNSFNTGGVLDVMALDGPRLAVTTSGIRLPQARVFNFSEDEGLGSVVYKDFTIKPCADTDEASPKAPLRVTYPGGIETFGLFG